ncbi:MAG: beta-ketoacyl synthase, partial [Gammaproteobacteria bacterium]|nr:beta-ketoacyl synthase [Gammaproteobacteria bacterium]
LMQNPMTGKRPTSKQVALALPQMPADFINAYVLGSVGFTSSITGACASFLYNLAAAVSRMRAGQCRVAVVGVSEAPLVPEIIEGYAAMNALATDANLARLDGADAADLTRASRPFGDNCGFTLAESAQFVVLMADDLAMELGADVHGAVPDVFIAADGVKTSISAPGPGNYLTMARAVGCAAAILGDEAVRQRSFVHAHGSSTPKNRVTESLILDRVAGAFGIETWPVTGIKSAVGHSLGAASGDQLASALGSFAWGIVPGIKTIETVANDVARDHLDIRCTDLDAGPLDLAFINSKGFGGNNASAPVISAGCAARMLERRHGAKAAARWQALRDNARAAAADYDAAMRRGTLPAIYRYGEPVIGDDDIGVSRDAVTLPGDRSVALGIANPYPDMV